MFDLVSRRVVEDVGVASALLERLPSARSAHLENQQKEIYELKSLADLVRCSLCKDIELDDAGMAVMRALAS